MKYDKITEASIDELMEIFYEKIREDNRGLGEIFNAKIGTDDESWKVHKAKIANILPFSTPTQSLKKQMPTSHKSLCQTQNTPCTTFGKNKQSAQQKIHSL